MNSMLRNTLLTFCVSLAVSTAHSAETQAIWQAATGNYSIGANWSNGSRPVNGFLNGTDTYAVTIGSGVITLNLDATVNSLSLSNARMDVSGGVTRTITAATTFGAGAIIGSGSLGLAGIAGLTAANTNVFLNLNGGAEISNGSVFTHSATGSGDTAIVLNADSSGSGSAFRNTATGTFNASTTGRDASIGFGAANAGNLFLNQGAFNKTGTFTYASNVAFQNTGTVNVQQGALHLNAGDNGSTTGTFAVSGGATLATGGGLTLGSGASIGGAGTLLLKSGTVALGSGSTLSTSNLQILGGTLSVQAGSTLGATALTMSGGTLDLNIAHTFTGASLGAGGTVIGSARTIFAGTTSLGTGSYVFGGSGVKEFSGATGFSTTAADQAFNINGGSEVQNSGAFTQTRNGSGLNTIVLNSDSVGGSSIFRNTATGTFTANMANGDGSVGSAVATAGNRFINEGSFVKTGTGAYAINVALTNNGSLSVQQGTLSINSGGMAAGSFAVASGATLGLNGTMNFQSTASVSGAGTVKLNGGVSTFLSGSSLSASTLQLAGGTMAFRTGSTLGATTLAIAGGTLELDLDHTFTGASFTNGGGVTGTGHATFTSASFDQNAYVFGGSGVKEFTGTTSLTTVSANQFFNINGGAEVKNSGTFIQTRNGSGTSTIVLNSDMTGGSSVFRNAASATFTASMNGGAGGIAAGAASSGNKFLNQGSFIKNGFQDYTVSVAFANSGTADVQQGSMFLTAGDGGSTTGAFTIQNNATLAANGGFTFGSGGSVSGAGTFQTTGTTTFGAGSSFTAAKLSLTGGGTTAFRTGSTLGTTALTVSGSTIELDINHTFNAVAFTNGGGVAGTGHTTFSGTTTFDQNSYVFRGTGVKEFTGTVSLQSTSANQFFNINGGGAEVKNSGTFSQIRSGGSTSAIVLNADMSGGSSIFRNATGANFTATMSGGAGGVFAGAASSGSKFINEGSFTKGGGFDYNVDVAFANSGTVNVQSGSLVLNGGDGGASSGTFTTQNGTTLTLGGGFTFGSGTTVSGSGTLQTNNGATTFNSGSALNIAALKVVGGTTAFRTGSTLNNATTLTITGGTLELDIDHTFTGAAISSGATFGGTGITTLNNTTLNSTSVIFTGTGVKRLSGTTAFSAGGTDSYLNLNGGAEVSNTGTFTQTRSGIGQSAIVLNANLAGGTTTFRNASGATFTADMTAGAGGITAGAASNGNKFINAGTFNKTGSSLYNVDVAFANSGTVNVQAGVLALNGGDGGASSGTFTTQNSTTLVLGGSFTFGSGATVSGSGTLQTNNGATTFNSGSALNASNLKVVGGTTAFRTGSTLNNASALTITGGTLELDIDHTFTSPAISSGATFGGTGITTFSGTNLNAISVIFTGSGVKRLAGNTTFASGATNSFLNINGGGAEVSNTGTFTQTKNGTGANAIVLNANSAGGTSTFRNATGATFTADMTAGAGGVTAGAASAGNKFINAGTFNKTGTSDYNADVAFANGGTVNVRQGVLSLNAGDGGATTGTFTTPSGTTLALGGGFAFGSGSNVSGTGTLQANNGVTTFNSGSALNASNLKVVGGTTAFRTGSTLNAATALTITGGTLELDIDHTFTNPAISSGATFGGTGLTTLSGTTLNSASVIFTGTGVKRFAGATAFSSGVASAFLNITGGTEVSNTGAFTQTKSDGGANAIVLASNGSGSSTFRNATGATFTADIATGTGSMGYGGASIGTNKFINSGAFNKTGTGVYQVNVPIDNAGSITVSQGTLSITAGVTNKAGSITVGSGTALDLSENANASTTGTLTFNGASLALGANNITIASDYTNPNFGSGNSFNGRAGVTGTGKILADTGTSLAYGGNATGNTLNFGVLHIGDTAVTKNYTVQNTGTSGVSVRGAIQTTAGGASITDSRLTGAGLTVLDLGKLDQGASTASRAVTFTPTTIGALTGQQLHVATNFDNVTPTNLALTGSVNYYADPAWTNATGAATLTRINATTYTLSFGTISMASGMVTSGFDLLNQLQDAIFQDALGGTFTTTGVTHFTLAGFGAFANVASGASDTGFAVSLNPSTLGSGNYSDVLILNPTSANASGTSTLSAIQLTIQANVTPIPEPGTIALLLASGLAFVVLRKTSRRRSA